MQKLVLVLVLLSLGIASCQKLNLLASVFSSNMVLQKAPQRAVLWGWTTTANEVVKVTFGGNTLMTSSAPRYPFKWSVRKPFIGHI